MMIIRNLFCVSLLGFAASAQTPAIQLKVAAVQFRSSFKILDNRDRIIKMLERLAAEGVKVAVFPECALTGYEKDAVTSPTAQEVGAAEDQIRRVCHDRRIAVVLGSVYRAPSHLYNTAVIFDSRGELVERYAKVMLAGEKWFTPGNHIAFFELEGVPSTVIICHDQRFPELVRLPAIQGARMIYYISSESKMARESKLKPYRAQMMARAVENTMFVVASNAPGGPRNYDGSHGQSRIINDDGNVLKEASFFGEDILIETISIKPGKLQRPLEGLMGDWWKQGVDFMMKNRHRPLE